MGKAGSDVSKVGGDMLGTVKKPFLNMRKWNIPRLGSHASVSRRARPERSAADRLVVHCIWAEQPSANAHPRTPALAHGRPTALRCRHADMPTHPYHGTSTVSAHRHNGTPQRRHTTAPTDAPTHTHTHTHTHALNAPSYIDAPIHQQPDTPIQQRPTHCVRRRL
eukprot:1180938-Prorocentrum_minimum.AAC.1